MNLKDATIDQNLWLRLLLYGPSGTGKTHFAGTFPEPIFLLDFDHKYTPMFGRDVELESFKTTKADAPQEYIRLRQVLKRVSAESKWKTIVIDSMSTLDPIVTEFVLKNSPRIDKATGRPIEHLDLQLYGHHADAWTWLAMDINAITGKHVVMIGHDQYKEKKEGSMTPSRTCPLLTGDKIQNKMPGLFQETYYYAWDFNAGQKVRRLTYRSTPSLIASSAVLTGQGYLDNPTFPSLLEEMRKCVEARKTAQAGKVG